MKKLIKYRICAMLILIVLMFSWIPVNAKITDPPSNVEGDGTAENPYVIDIGAVGGRIVLKPDAVPFNFIVKGTGGIGGLFTVDYDVSNGLVAFTLTETVDVIPGANMSTATVAREKGHSNAQFGITSKETTETLSPKYDIKQKYTYWDRYKNSSEAEHENCTLTNANAPVVTGAYYAKDDLYYFANDPEFLSLDLVQWEPDPDNEDLSDIDVVIDSIERYFGSYSLKNIIKLYEASGYKLIDDMVDEYPQWFWGIYIKHSLMFIKTDGNHKPSVYIGLVRQGKENVQIKPVTMMYTFNGKTITTGGKDGKADLIEEILTRILMLLGDGVLLTMIRGALSKDLTINSLIFNQYKDTTLSFYSSSPSKLSKNLADVVNAWYKVFQELAYILYFIILVYIAIMIIATAGTPEQDKSKKNLGNWFAGLAIMTVVPMFVIPTLIKLNDAFVKFMYNRNGTEIKTYYNVEFPAGEEVISGGDSATVSIEELMDVRNEKVAELEKFEKEKEKILDEITDDIEDVLSYDLTEDERKFIYDRYMWMYENTQIFVFDSSRKAEDMEKFKTDVLSTAIEAVRRATNAGRIRGEIYGAFYKYFNSDDKNIENLLNKFKEIYTKEQTINAIDQLIESRNTDLMTVMRTKAGETGRLVFAVVWYSLLFQFIAMIFIYYKRVFVIAILIAIFPLIMIFYCIDKMADGSAQTLSMWFKELIADIFVQSVHCVIYTVLVQMGLEIYNNDPNNWFLFLAAMMLLVPAEKMMKEIFGLNSSTLGQLGGMGMKLAAGVGAAWMLAKMGGRKIANKVGGKKNKAAIDMANKQFSKLQGKQNKADLKSERRDNKQRIADMKNAQRAASGKKGIGMAIRNGMYRAGTAARSAREKMHEKGTARRERQASRIPKKAEAQARKESAKQALKVAGGIAYGLYSAANGDGIEGFYAGVKTAEEATREKTVSGKDAVLKDELETAYKRKAAKRNKN